MLLHRYNSAQFPYKILINKAYSRFLESDPIDEHVTWLRENYIEEVDYDWGIVKLVQKCGNGQTYISGVLFRFKDRETAVHFKIMFPEKVLKIPDGSWFE